jgi:predicted metal-binding membrane protein
MVQVRFGHSGIEAACLEQISSEAHKAFIRSNGSVLRLRAFRRGFIWANASLMTPAVPSLRRSNPVAQQPGRRFVRPKYVAISCLMLLAALGWICIGLMLAGAGFVHQPLPGGQPVAHPFADRIGLFGWGQTTYEVLCQPTFGMADSGGAAVAAVALMWIAMVLAMMLPAAGPMILTYSEMAERAARKGGRAVSPLVLISGYGLVWAGFAVAAAALQLTLTRAAFLDPSIASASTLFSGAMFVAAGLYQFSALKQACVTLCQQPAPFFSANWSERPRDIFRQGVRQGLYCVGCCWAIMLVMFAVGVMNVIWMAALGFIMAAEKITTTTRFSKAIGIVFILIGIGFVAAAVVAHWPVRVG